MDFLCFEVLGVVDVHLEIIFAGGSGPNLGMFRSNSVLSPMTMSSLTRHALREGSKTSECEKYTPRKLVGMFPFHLPVSTSDRVFKS